jgi:hypothetical protein
LQFHCGKPPPAAEPMIFKRNTTCLENVRHKIPSGREAGKPFKDR